MEKLHISVHMQSLVGKPESLKFFLFDMETGLRL